jgi:hypothetical protein
MRKILMFLPLLILALFSTVVSAASIPIGVISLDPTGVASGATFDIQNLTGLSALPPDFPVTTALTLDITSLTLDFTSGPPQVLTSSDFTADGFGGFTGNNIFDLSSTSILSATLMGTLMPTSIIVAGSGSETLDGSFSAIVLPSSGTSLSFFDNANITAPTAVISGTPEPGSYVLMALSLIFAIVLVSHRR